MTRRAVLGSFRRWVAACGRQVTFPAPGKSPKDRRGAAQDDRFTLISALPRVLHYGAITGYRMRCPQSKLTTVKALQSMGYETIASGDSFNDLGMIQASKAGFLFKSTQAIRADHPELPAFEEFGELLEAIKGAID